MPIEPEQGMTAVIIPMYHEAGRLDATLDAMLAWLSDHPGEVSLILAVDDGSTDDSCEVARGWIARFREKGIEHQVASLDRHRGKGAAVRMGLELAVAAGAEWILMSDADHATPLGEITKLRDGAARTDAALVVGSREAPGALTRSRIDRRIIGRLFQAYASMLGFHGIRDTQCGFKLYRADAAALLAKQSREEGFLFDIEHITLLRSAGMPIAEVGVLWTHQPHGQVHPLRDGLRMAWGLCKLRLRLQR